jgi:hypothetical protein
MKRMILVAAIVLVATPAFAQKTPANPASNAALIEEARRACQQGLQLLKDNDDDQLIIDQERRHLDELIRYVGAEGPGRYRVESDKLNQLDEENKRRKQDLLDVIGKCRSFGLLGD